MISHRPSPVATVLVTEVGDLAGAVGGLGGDVGQPVLVIVGGADEMSFQHSTALVDLFARLVPALDRWGAVVVDGGTDAGAMRAIGRARAGAGARFPLVGVVCATMVEPTSDTAATVQSDRRPRALLEPNHTMTLLVPGTGWGDEVPWLSAVAATIAGQQPSATLAVNGGRITYDDVEASLVAARPVVVLRGAGRAADAIAAALTGTTDDDRASELAASGLVHQVCLSRPDELTDFLKSTLCG